MRPDTPSDPRPLRLEVPSGVASVTDEGAGPAVVCVHGLPGSSRDFRWLAPALTARGLRVVRLELPGFGQAPEPPPGASSTVAALGHYVSEVIAALRLEAPTLLGHSFGGTIALNVAAHRPEEVGRLALVASMGTRRHRGFREFGWGVELGRWAGVPGLGGPVGWLLEAGFRRFGFRHDVDSQTVLRTMKLIDNFDFAHQAAAVARLRVPTAMVWSLDDPLIEAEIAEHMAQRLPEGPRLRFPDGTHNPQKHYAVEIADNLATWIGVQR
ncbi:MAG: alpha/beta hydrolase [Myxococcota bacterium]